jgi:signal transduction histidine kinase/CheY-like chemotaxis protein
MPASFTGSSHHPSVAGLLASLFTKRKPEDAMPSTFIAAGIGTAELNLRPSRAPDFEGESRALVRLVAAQTGPRERLLQGIANAALGLCCAGSAGISLIEQSAEGERCFRWLAVSGAFADLRGKATAWSECPCRVTIESGAPQLFLEPQRHFACLQGGPTSVSEGLIVPIETDGVQLGAIWAMSHSKDCRFEREDVRLLTNLAVVAGAALTVVDARDLNEEQRKRHDEFIALLGHELRNPIAPIDSAVHAAKAFCAGNERALEMLAIAQRQMRHLKTLVDDLLDAARLQHGKLNIRMSDTSLNEVIFDAITAIRHHIDGRRHKLTVTGLDETIYVRADHVRVSQIIGNLLGNAAKYTPIGGEIQVAVNCERTGSEHAPGGIVSIVVSDNGTGIPPEVMPHVFNLFIQSHHTAGIGGGLGIGLAVVKRLVELHDGSIAVRSGGDGQGTQVTLRLPILRSQLGPYCPPTVSTEPSSLPVHVLLVDDNRDALDALSAVLQVAGHTVESRTTGPAALELLETSMPDIAIVDIGMPGMDGFAVARAIRSSGAYQHLLLVALTGYASESDAARALAAGFDYHLAKPLSLDKLNSILRERMRKC